MASCVHQAGTIASETPLRVGTATILAGGNTIAVADTNITATSVVICWGIGASDARVLTFSVDNIVAGVGFNINAGYLQFVGSFVNVPPPPTSVNVPPLTVAANKVVGWAVLRY
jgi:hypothetical protein